MIYKYELEIRRGAEICVNALSENGFSAFVLGDSIREYSIKIGVLGEQHLGNISVYYSPKKKKYSLITAEINYPGYSEKIQEICIPQLNAMLPFENPAAGDPPQITSIPELYVDGSHRKGHTSYAFALVENKAVVYSSNGLLTEAQSNGTHQIAGELEAIIKGLDWCKNNGIKEVRICHDLINSQKWATGEFKANNPVTQRYVEFIKQCPVHIRWKKVLAHSGIHFNEFVDKLASDAFKKSSAKE